jgi:uncharacterized protein YuzE
MQISYNAKTDVLYMRFDDRKQPVMNRQVSDDVILDTGAGEKVVGIEILGASIHVNLKDLLPVEYQISAGISS